MSRYDALTVFLSRSLVLEVPMTFGEIEGVLGRRLPPSAFRHRSFWSNNGDNNVMTKAWLAAGFESAEVDMKGQKLTFLMAAPTPVPLHHSHNSGKESRAVDFRFDTKPAIFDVPRAALSSRALEWLEDDMNNGDEKNKLVLDAIEGMVSKSIRLKIVEKYSALKIGGGSDSVLLIREDRDGR